MDRHPLFQQLHQQVVVVEANGILVLQMVGRVDPVAADTAIQTDPGQGDLGILPVLLQVKETMAEQVILIMLLTLAVVAVVAPGA